MSRARAKLGMWVAITVGALLLGLYLLFLEPIRQQIVHGPDSIARQKQLNREAGLPASTDDLQIPLPPEAENAAPDYTQLAKLLKQNPIPQDIDLLIAQLGDSPKGHLPSSISLQRVRQALDERRDMLKIIHTAARKPRLVTPRSLDVSSAEFNAIREASRMLRAESMLLALAGRWQPAIETQTLGFALAIQVDSQQGWIGHLLAVSCEAYALNGMEGILHTAAANLEVDQSVERVLASYSHRLSLQHALASEMVSLLNPGEYFRTAVDSLKTDPMAESGGAGAPPAGGLNAVTLHWMDEGAARIAPFARDYVLAANLPFPDRLEKFRQIGAQMDQAIGHDRGFLPLPTNPGEILGTMAWKETMPELVYKDAQIIARENVDRAAAGVLAYRAQHGVYPSGLPDALRPPPADPFTSHPLRFAAQNNGFVVYSVGRSGTFNGTPVPTGPGTQKSAEVFFNYRG